MAKQSYPKELIAQAREYYLNNEISLTMLASVSEDLFGTPIEERDLKWFAFNDPEGRWSILKVNQGKKTSEVPTKEKLRRVADKLYELIVDEEDPIPNSSLAQLTRTWLEINMRANLDSVSTAKTSIQSAKDLIAQMESNRPKKD